jgi:pimeloyl-ACP methyl ester carboxylesterase
MAASLNKKYRINTADDARVAAGVSKGPVYNVPGLCCTDNKITVPLDYSGELPGSIDVFFRVVVSRNKQDDNSLPYLLYLQGGPGFESPRPLEGHSGWLKSAVNYFKVVLMDQRGTGLSSGITAASLELQGSPENQARYLQQFRADSIVRDAEAIRQALLVSGLANGNLSSSDSRWTLLGQSFGGFCCTTYLSMYPQSLAEVLMTGGLPPGILAPCSAEDVYRRTFQRVLGQNAKFYARFPAAGHRACQVVAYLMSQPNGSITTPAGNTLSPRSFQLLGLHTLGFSHGLERLNFLLESALDPATGAISQRFMKDFDTAMAWDTNPLYALLHESIYCQGASSRWAAHRVRETECKDEFDAVKALNEGKPIQFTGEMVFPWMFDEFKELRRIKAAAELIANETNWNNLYDVDVLANNTVAVAAASYFEDMFVDFELAQETARSIKGIRQFVTNEYLHDGIKESGAAIFDKLLNMARGGVLLR